MMWYKNKNGFNWHESIDETWNGTVKILSKDNVILNINGGTLNLSRIK